MRRTIRSGLQWVACTGAVAALSACSWMPWGSKDDPTVVPFKTITSGAYQGYLKNWDDAHYPVFCALIHDRTEWDAWMQIQAVAGDKRPAGPSSAHFGSYHYLVVGRVISAPDAAERPHIFTPLSVSARDGVLKLNYLYRAPVSDATYKVKETLTLAIPRERPATSSVVFYENDKKVCEVPG